MTLPYHDWSHRIEFDVDPMTGEHWWSRHRTDHRRPCWVRLGKRALRAYLKTRDASRRPVSAPRPEEP